MIEDTQMGNEHLNMNNQIYHLKNIVYYPQKKLLNKLEQLLHQIIQALFQRKVKLFRFLWIFTLTSLLFIVLAQLDIAPLQSQMINLPEEVTKKPSIDINQVGNLDIGKVRLDGKFLFPVATPSVEDSGNGNTSSPIERRVRAIEFNLSDIIHDGFDPNTLKVIPSYLNNQTVIIASDKDWGPRMLLTVTPADVAISKLQNTDKVAEKLSEKIEQALRQAWKQRQPGYQREQIPKVLAILALMVLLSFGVKILQRIRASIRHKLEKQLNDLEAKESNLGEPISVPNHQDEKSLPLPQAQPRSGLSSYLPQLTIAQKILINLIIRRLLFTVQIIIWFGGMAMICQWFPQTYAFSRWLLRVPLAYIGILLGISILNLVVDTIIQSVVERIVDRLEENGNADIRLRPRARTILLVLEELSGYISVLLGLLVFFYIINAMQVILIAFGVIAFLSQDILRNFLRTYFILLEDQYALGDWIQIGNINGQVEKVSLRATQVRARWGDLLSISHGGFDEVINFSHRYSGINLRINVAYNTDLDRAIAVIERVAKEMQQDSLVGKDITAIKMKGVETFGDNSITINLILNTKPGKYWDVGLEYRRRLKPALDKAGIKIPFPQRSIWFENALIPPKEKEK